MLSVPFLCLVTLLELFTLYASGHLDGSTAIPNEFISAVIQCSLGKSKHEMVRVSSEVNVGEAVSSLGQFIEYHIPVPQEITSSPSAVDAATAESLGKGTP